jgi:hypothetical protein
MKIRVYVNCKRELGEMYGSRRQTKPSNQAA